MKHFFTTSAIATAVALGLGSTTAFADTPTVNVVTDPSFVPFEMLDPETEGEPVTPTRKVKRKQMEARFRDLIESMYGDAEARLLAQAASGVRD